MPGSSTNVESTDKKDNLRRRSRNSQNERIEANVKVVDGAVGARHDLQELTPLKQGLSRTHLRLLRSLEDAAGVEQEETPQTEDAYGVSGEPPLRRKR